MKQKPVFSTELAYLIGLAALAFGAAFMERADLGMSMVVAPAYIIHLKVSQYLPFFTFGMSEYVLQAVLRRFRVGYLFSFVTAVIYGFVLDLAIRAVSLLPFGGWGYRIGFFALGILLCAVGVSFLFHTYISPEVYELFVKEISAKWGTDIHRTKTIYDCSSCLVGVILSFAFFGLWHFEGVKIGTIVCAAVNGPLIGLVSRLLESVFRFGDSLPLRRLFER